MEGLICPLCLTSFLTVDSLQDHFLDCTEKQVIIDNTNVNGIDNEQSDMLVENFLQQQQEEEVIDLQSIGYVKSLTDEFKNIRNEQQLELVIKVNRLLIRLRKLLQPEESKSIKTTLKDRITKTKLEKNIPSNCYICNSHFKFNSHRFKCSFCSIFVCGNCVQDKTIELDLICQIVPISELGRYKTNGDKNSLTTGGEKTTRSTNDSNGSNNQKSQISLKTCHNCQETYRMIIKKHNLSKLDETEKRLIKLFKGIILIQQNIKSISDHHLNVEVENIRLILQNIVKLRDQIQQLNRELDTGNNPKKPLIKIVQAFNKVTLNLMETVKTKWSSVVKLKT